MIDITKEQMNFMIKIIAAVETGGQILGQARYDDYTPAYTNSSTEDSITIGAFQEFKWYAKALLQEILNTCPSIFIKFDSTGIETDLKQASWSGYNPDKNSKKAKEIQAIISSPEGIKIQNLRIERLLKEYIKFAESKGVTDIDALFMCANFIHQGGESACTRILAKTQKPYTLENIYHACQTDTGNQVGAYKTRQQKIYNWLKNQLPNKGDDKMGIIEQVRKDAVDFAVKISKDNSHGYSQAVRSLYNITNPTSFDCSSLICTAYYYAFIKNGLTSAANYLKANCSYTGNMLKMQNCGFEIVAKNQTAHGQMILGDIEINTTHHTALAIDSDNIVHARSSEGTSNTKDDSGNEIRTQPWYLYSSGWTHRLRFTGKGLDLSNVSPTPSIPSPTDPSKTYNKTTKWTGVVTTSGDTLNVRTLPGSSNPTCSFSPLVNGAEFEVCDEVINDGAKWYYIKYDGKYGFVHGDYVKKKTEPSVPSTSTPPTITTVKVFAINGVKLPELAASKKPSGAAVGVVQTILKVPVTNTWDTATATAVKAFKASVGLPATSASVGEQTWIKLMEELSKQVKNNA